jgi:hypothetical protein
MTMRKVSLGLIPSSGVTLKLRLQVAESSAEEITCYRYICEDAILFIPVEKRKGGLARAIGETSLLAMGAAGGLLTVAALAPIVAAGAILNKSKVEEKTVLRQAAEVLTHQGKTIDECIVFPIASLSDLEVEKQSFSLISVNKNPFTISVVGSVAVFGNYYEVINGSWIEPNETKCDEIHDLLHSLTDKTRWGGGGGVTLFWKDRW